jgi:tetratricopeptide (TPR) repeat protein
MDIAVSLWHTRGEVNMARLLRFLLNSLIAAVVMLGPLAIAAAQQIPYVLKIEGVGTGEFYVTPPGGSRQSVSLALKQHIPVGSTIEAPANRKLTLQTRAGTTIIHQRSTMTIEASSSKGESFFVAAGNVVFDVVSKLGFYSVSGPGAKVQFAVRGTQFSVGVNDKQLALNVIEGQVRRDKKVKVDVAEQAKGHAAGRNRPLDTTQTETFTAGNGNVLGLDYYEEEVQRFPTYAEAQAHFQNALAQQGADPESLDVADDYVMLGELSLADDHPQEAIAAYKSALKIHRKLLNSVDPIVADDEEGLGYAYLDAGDAKQALQHFQITLQIYQAIYPKGDSAFVGAYTNLGVAYGVAGVEDKASENLKRALSLATKDANFDRAYTEALLADSATVDPEEVWEAAIDAQESYEVLALLARLVGDDTLAAEAEQSAAEFSKIAKQADFISGQDNLDDVESYQEAEAAEGTR